MTIDERIVACEIRPFHFVAAGELQGANLSFRFDVLERVNGFDPDLGAGTKFPCEDIDIIASILWAGFPARFEPGPVVFHHHGRKWKSSIPQISKVVKVAQGYVGQATRSGDFAADETHP